MISFVETYGDDDLVLIVLGDHQPSSVVSGRDASHDVPVTVSPATPRSLSASRVGPASRMNPSPGRARRRRWTRSGIDSLPHSGRVPIHRRSRPVTLPAAPPGPGCRRTPAAVREHRQHRGCGLLGQHRRQGSGQGAALNGCDAAPELTARSGVARPARSTKQPRTGSASRRSAAPTPRRSGWQQSTAPRGRLHPVACRAALRLRLQCAYAAPPTHRLRPATWSPRPARTTTRIVREPGQAPPSQRLPRSHWRAPSEAR